MDDRLSVLLVVWGHIEKAATIARRAPRLIVIALCECPADDGKVVEFALESDLIDCQGMIGISRTHSPFSDKMSLCWIRLPFTIRVSH